MNKAKVLNWVKALSRILVIALITDSVTLGIGYYTNHIAFVWEERGVTSTPLTDFGEASTTAVTNAVNYRTADHEMRVITKYPPGISMSFLPGNPVRTFGGMRIDHSLQRY